MGKVYECLSERMVRTIEEQHLFFVATAPLQSDGHVNVSPKGLDSLRVLDERRIVYADLVGSTNETGAHLSENGRITLMFCTFVGRPEIIRVYGQGSVERTSLTAPSPAALELFPDLTGIRQLVRIEIDSVRTSCGFGVPLYDYLGERDSLPKWTAQLGPDGLEDYDRVHATWSADGLPCVRPPTDDDNDET